MPDEWWGGTVTVVLKKETENKEKMNMDLQAHLRKEGKMMARTFSSSVFT